MSWIRKKKKYNRPRQIYDSQRIQEENLLVQQYGLKNKKEIWKADAAIGRLRAQAKEMITASEEDRKHLFDKLNKIGFKVEKIADVLGLEKEDWLKRRLQTIVYKKGLAQSPKGARQKITHKHIMIDGNVVNTPSYIVKVEEENKITERKKKVKKPKVEKKEDVEEKPVTEEKKDSEKDKENVQEEVKEDKKE